MSKQHTVSSKIIDSIIATGPSPQLKLLGYRKAGRRFYLQSQDSVAHIRFQSSQWNTPERARFTINLSRYFPAIAQKNGDPVELDPAKQRLMHAGIRIGHLLPQREDYWWCVSSDGEIEVAAQEVVSALQDFGFPYLDSISSLEGVAKLSGCIPEAPMNAPTKSRASALFLLGREVEAQVVLTEMARIHALARSTKISQNT